MTQRAVMIDFGEARGLQTACASAGRAPRSISISPERTCSSRDFRCVRSMRELLELQNCAFPNAVLARIPARKFEHEHRQPILRRSWGIRSPWSVCTAAHSRPFRRRAGSCPSKQYRAESSPDTSNNGWLSARAVNEQHPAAFRKGVAKHHAAGHVRRIHHHFRFDVGSVRQGDDAGIVIFDAWSNCRYSQADQVQAKETSNSARMRE